MILRTGTLVAGSNSITLNRTSDLTPGLFLYGTGIPVETKVASISTEEIILSDKNSTMSASNLLEITTANVGTKHERDCILQDIKDEVDERGDHVYIDLRDEEDLTKDRYRNNVLKSQLRAGRLFLRAYPVEFRPSIYRLEKAGLRQETDCVIWTSMQDWIQAGIDFDNIEMRENPIEEIKNQRFSVKLQGSTWAIKEKALVLQVNDTFAYITLGLNKT